MTDQSKDALRQSVYSAWRRYVVLLVGLALVFLVITIAIAPWPYDFAVERFLLPGYEAAFGFRGGRVPLRIETCEYTLYGIVEVTPTGRMARAGVRVGDVPVERHGGLWAFYSALHTASASKEGHFTVLAQADWPDWSKCRKITLPSQLAAQ